MLATITTVQCMLQEAPHLPIPVFQTLTLANTDPKPKFEKWTYSTVNYRPLGTIPLCVVSLSLSIMLGLWYSQTNYKNALYLWSVGWEILGQVVGICI